MNVISVSFPPLARDSIPPPSWNGFILPHFHSGNHLRRIPEQLHTWKEYSTLLFKCGGTNWIQSTDDDPPTNQFLTSCVPYLQLGVILLECGYCYGFPIAPNLHTCPEMNVRLTVTTATPPGSEWKDELLDLQSEIGCQGILQGKEISTTSIQEWSNSISFGANSNKWWSPVICTTIVQA